jgi:anti-sigma B factor antagonist
MTVDGPQARDNAGGGSSWDTNSRDRGRNQMLLRVDVDEREDHALIRAVGEIDASTADSVATAVSEALAAGHRRVLLDLGDMTFIDSTGLGMLVRSHRAADAASARFAVVHPTAQTRKLITVLGLDELLHVHDSPEQALAAE